MGLRSTASLVAAARLGVFEAVFEALFVVFVVFLVELRSGVPLPDPPGTIVLKSLKERGPGVSPVIPAQGARATTAVIKKNSGASMIDLGDGVACIEFHSKMNSIGGEVIEAINKGIDIAGKVGEPVLAASDGKVVYAGNSLRGYGNLVIVKHDNTYLTAYAHNSKLLVKEGDSVRKGQKIAEMGDTDTNSPKLHFELRVNGKPVNPTPYIQ